MKKKTAFDIFEDFNCLTIQIQHQKTSVFVTVLFLCQNQIKLAFRFEWRLIPIVSDYVYLQKQNDFFHLHLY